jgi:hypothetical protein
MQEIPLSTYGLETVAEVCQRKKWSAKTVQNWVNAGLLPAVVIGAGRSAKFLLRTEDVNSFTPPPRGRPVKTLQAEEPQAHARQQAKRGARKRR